MTHKNSVMLYLLLASVLSVCVSALPLLGQVLYGSIVGTVSDQTGAVVPGAHVTVTNPLTGLKREVDVNPAGQYNIPNLPEGSYTLTVSAKGFKETNQTNLGLRVGQIVRADVSLEVGAVTQEITVQASTAQLQTEKTDVSTALGTVPVENLPTGFYRNFQSLLLLVPGAVDNYGYTGATADTPERALAIPMNGMDPASNSTRIDGAQSIFLWKPGGAALYIPPIESIQEVKITTNSFEPEKGMAGAAAVDVITKSGTNNMHGVLFWYHNNQHLNSCEPFSQNCKWRVFDPTHPQSKPKDLLNDMGGNLGGPIKKDKLFYFANWDGVFERVSYDGRYAVPTEDMRRGDFSAYLGDKINIVDAKGNVIGPLMVPVSNGHGVIAGGADLNCSVTPQYCVQAQQGMVFDPNTPGALANGVGRAVYADGTTATSVGKLNVLPSDLFVPTAQTILGPGYWPLPNVNPALWTHDTEGVAGRNYFLSTPQRFNRNNLDFKVDWNRTDRHLVWGKYSRMMALTAVNCGYNANIGGPCPAGSDGKTNVTVQTATLGHTWSLTPTFLLDGTLGLSRMVHLGLPSDFGKNVGSSVFGIPGTNDPNDIRYSGAPQITIAGFDALGSPYTWLPLYRNDWTATITQNASWTRSKHTLRFGVDIVHNHINHWQPENGFGPRGGVNFSDGNAAFVNLLDASGKPIQTDRSFYAFRDAQFASFLLGIYGEAGRTIQFQKANGKDTWYGLHLLERWKATPKLTLNLGLRYEYFPLMSRDSLGKGIEQYDPTTNMVLLGGLGGNPKNLGVTTQKTMLEPRIGVAYQLNELTVLRAGFGSTYDTFPILRETRGAYPSTISTDTKFESTLEGVFDSLASCQAGMGVLCDFQGLGRASDGIAAVPIPDVSTGEIPGCTSLPTPADAKCFPLDVEMRFIGRGQLKRGRVETWNVSVERKLPGEMLLGIGYVGNSQANGWGIKDLNASDIDQSAPLTEKWGRTGGTYQLQGFLDSHYNALQVTLDRHFSKGLYLKGAYTYSKAINMSYDTDAWSGGFWNPPLFSGPSYLGRNRGMADIDRRQIFRLGYIWDLPIGSGRKYMNSNRIGRAVLGGWQFNGVWTTLTGAPTTVFGNPQFRSSGNHQTVDQVLKLEKLGCLGPGDNCHWYDPKAFAPVPLVTDADGVERQHRFGTTGRNIAVYGPRSTNLDASLFRHFQLTERFDLQFRAEGLNVLNHPRWNWSTDEWGASNYCWGGGPVGNPCGGSGSTFMQAPDASGHRILRFGLRLAF